MKKFISLTLIGATSILSTIGYVYSEPPQSMAPRSPKALISKLPASVEGVELVGNAVHTKPGYKFVKHGNSVTVARMGGGGKGGGLGLGGTWSCSCSGGGSCSIVSNSTGIICSSSGGTCQKCTLTISTTGFSGAVIAY